MSLVLAVPRHMSVAEKSSAAGAAESQPRQVFISPCQECAFAGLIDSKTPFDPKLCLSSGQGRPISN